MAMGILILELCAWVASYPHLVWMMGRPVEMYEQISLPSFSSVQTTSLWSWWTRLLSRYKEAGGGGEVD